MQDDSMEPFAADQQSADSTDAVRTYLAAALAAAPITQAAGTEAAPLVRAAGDQGRTGPRSRHPWPTPPSRPAPDRVPVDEMVRAE